MPSTTEVLFLDPPLAGRLHADVGEHVIVEPDGTVTAASDPDTATHRLVRYTFGADRFAVYVTHRPRASREALELDLLRGALRLAFDLARTAQDTTADG